MSTAHNNVLWLRPYDEIDKHVPDCGLSVLPGRLASLTHPLNKGRRILLPDKELYDPDVATVVSSGITGFEKGDIVVLAPDHGAYYPRLGPDKRELRIVGVACPWYESVLAKLDANGLHPAPGWMLVETVVQDTSPARLQPRRVAPRSVATVLASCGDDWAEPHKNERVCIEGMRTYVVAPSQRTLVSRKGKRGVEQFDTKTLALVRAPIASTKWLQSLRTQT